MPADLDGALLAYLFEVTERFGMETRTELILLQRTMVVVEGVSRSLDPDINIWVVGKAGGRGIHHRSCGAEGRRARSVAHRAGPCRGSARGCRRWPNRRCWLRRTRSGSCGAALGRSASCSR